MVSTVGEVVTEIGAGAVVARWRFKEEDAQVGKRCADIP
jgi:hypothetical protein